MGASSEYYVDPVGGDDGDTGGIGDPWKTVQNALDTITQNAADGDRINVKAGGTDTLAAKLDFTTYGSPTLTAPLVIQGYTAAARDRGIGSLSGGGTASIFDETTREFVYFVDMELTNTGANHIIRCTGDVGCLSCELHNSTGRGMFLDGGVSTGPGYAYDCHFHNLGRGFHSNGGTAAFCTFQNDGTQDMDICIRGSTHPVNMTHNLFVVDGATVCIEANTPGIITFNSIWSNAGTGTGIQLFFNRAGCICMGNIVEGFSGAGGLGIDAQADSKLALVAHNLLYNNTTNLNNPDAQWIAASNNNILTSSPFRNAANGDFRVTTTPLANSGFPAAFRGYPNTLTHIIQGATGRPVSFSRTKGLLTGIGPR